MYDLETHLLCILNNIVVYCMRYAWRISFYIISLLL